MIDQNLKKIIPFILPYKWTAFWNIFFNILYSLFSTLSFIAMIPMLEVLFDESKKDVVLPVYEGVGSLTRYLKDYLYYHLYSLQQQDGAQYALLLAVVIVISTFMFKNMFGFLASNHLTKLKNGVLKDLRKNMYNQIISLPVSYYTERRKGDIMARMLGDLGEVQNSFFLVLELIVKEPFIIIFSIIAMFSISVKLTLFVFVFIPISGWIISKVGKNLKANSRKLQEESSRMISVVEESLSGIKIVKSYNAEETFSGKFNQSVNQILRLSNKIGIKNNLASPLSEFLGIIVIAILLWYGGRMVLVEKMTSGVPLLKGAEFIVYMGLAYNILTPAKAISKASFSVKNGLAAAQRVFEVLEVQNDIVEPENAIVIDEFKSELQLKNITFSYKSTEVLKDFSMTVQKGKTIALVGQSGSGKSTIANLLLRFYDLKQGEILIDGLNIKDINTKSYRKLIGYVSQESILFNDTIKENLLIGKPDATDDEIIEALKIANAYEFVEKLSEGFNSNIGDAGGKLSGGQRQRLSIARAVLKNPPIMILDEATSALDTESERLVQDALENMMENRTSIVIAHRLSTIQKADTILVMHHGKVIEQGNHKELIALKGTYKKLVDMQEI
jgi:subfamily B ATP-binding cassette protein MsbA